MTDGSNKFWFGKLVLGIPHQIIGEAHDPYLMRWYLIPRNKYLNIYLHRFCRSDDDRALHDHPWWFASLVLRGGYWEERANKPVLWRMAGSFAVRRPTEPHRVELEVDDQGREKPCWTIIVTGPRIRSWGFHCPKGWVHWKRFVHRNGCGEE